MIDTSIMQTVAQIFSREDGDGTTAQLKSKVMHILVNLAVGSKMEELIEPKYGVLA